MIDSTDAVSAERKLHLQMIVALGMLSLLLSLVFSQRGAVFTPPALIAASALPPSSNAPTANFAMPGNGTGPASPQPAGRGVAGQAGFAPATGAPSALPAPASGAASGGDLGQPTPAPEIAPAIEGVPFASAAPVGTSSGGSPGAFSALSGGIPGSSGGSAPGASSGGTNTPDGGTTPPPSPTTPNPTTPVPEPGTWLMLILGIGIIGAELRRRSAGAAQHQAIIAR
ncbi:PEP-CTERM motif-containing protein [Sphingobium yanoikuyae]|uniref:PEP-CTERM motif-containing protein n=1 Tax=Sphingobium yanoikuyae TaxID=13690 RepID=A0A084EBD4_SPHYA|nr:PEPxxWA-CTERM sorting domain-containing protein [Sphingobium yanoikuyae]KEZ15276.1 PEP-CTERM motif-containing protein [Sphingobium yanoikuyae]